MAKFCFYKGDDADVIYRLRQAAVYCWEKIEEVSLSSFRLFIAAEDHARCFCSTDGTVGAIAGYARCDGLGNVVKDGDDNNVRHNRRFIEEVTEKEWSLGNNWTGSFAAVAYSESRREVTLCNDIIGHLALYYSNLGDGMIGGTSLIVLSRTLKSKVDPVGVLQKITAPYCNYGRRTLLKNVYRLLPGERLKWLSANSGYRSEFDNSLCNGIINSGLQTTARSIWDCLQNEIFVAVGLADQIGIAMSGGLDSRLVLGGVAHRSSVLKCFTYGNEDHYESKIARRCANALGASHECFPLEEKYFPARQTLEPLIRETESGNYMEWLGIIEKAKEKGEKMPLLLGDLCESIDGRYITTFSSRKARIKSFLKGFSGIDDFFNPATSDNLRQWIEDKRKEIVSAILANRHHLSCDLIGDKSVEYITAEIESDLELSFARVRDNMPPYEAMFDELFIWFHRIRFLLGNQITWLGTAFHPVSPAMSMRFLRLITKVPPNLRLRKRLMNAIIKLPEFDVLARIPSAQIPFVHSRAPNLIKEVLWGARSGLDQILIKRNLKNKKSNGRQRVLRSLDYVKEYQRESAAVNVKNWFSEKHIKSDDYLKIFHERAALNAWTLINVDITAPANVSIILDLCQAENSPKKYFEA